MESRVVDFLIALAALAAVAASLGTIMVFVAEPDLIIVLCIGIGMAAFDFFRTFFKRRNGN